MRLIKLAAALATAGSLPIGPFIPRLGAQALEPDSGVAAYVGNSAILGEDLDRWWRRDDPVSYERVRREAYEARRRALDALVADKLLARQAAARGISLDDLLQSESARRARPVTADAVANFIAENPLPLPMSDAVTPLVTALLQKRALESARSEFLDGLRRDPKAAVQILLEPPRVAVARSRHNPTRGPSDAPVEVVVFSDFQCPYCRRAEPTLDRLVKRFPNQILLAWRHYPLSIHADARGAAEAAQCAHDQERFWDYRDALFAEPSKLQRASLLATARRLGLEIDTFEECVTSRAHAADVSADVKAGEQAGVSGTPTVFIDGIGFVGALPYETYERAVTDALARRAMGLHDTSPPSRRER